MDTEEKINMLVKTGVWSPDRGQKALQALNFMREQQRAHPLLTLASKTGLVKAPFQDEMGLLDNATNNPPRPTADLSEMQQAPEQEPEQASPQIAPTSPDEMVQDPAMTHALETMGATQVIASKASDELGRLNAEMSANSDLAADVLRARQREFDDSVERNDKARTETLAEYKQMLQPLLETKFDPDRYWKNKSTGATVTAAIAMAVGQYVEGMTDGKIPNRAAQMINQAIERDIEAQKLQYAAAKDKADIGGQLYALARQQGLDDLSARNMSYAMSLSLINTQLEKTKLNIENTKAQAALAQTQAALQQAAQDRMDKVTELKARKLEEGFSPNEIGRLLETGKYKAEQITPSVLNKEAAGRWVDGAGLTRTAKQAQDINEVLPVYTSAFRVIDTAAKKLDDLERNWYGKTASAEFQAERERLVAELTGLIKNEVLPQAGNLAEHEKQNVVDTFGDFSKRLTRLESSSMKKQLLAFRDQSLTPKIKDKLRVAGLYDRKTYEPIIPTVLRPYIGASVQLNTREKLREEMVKEE